MTKSTTLGASPPGGGLRPINRPVWTYRDWSRPPCYCLDDTCYCLVTPTLPGHAQLSAQTPYSCPPHPTVLCHAVLQDLRVAATATCPPAWILPPLVGRYPFPCPSGGPSPPLVPKPTADDGLASAWDFMLDES